MTDPSALASQPTPPDPTPRALSAVELTRWAWRQLTSMRTALILLLLLIVAAVPGSLVPQRRVDPAQVSRWQSEYPGLTPLFERLGLFDVYSSTWFSAIYLLLMTSLIGCILPRIRVYWRGLMAPPARAPRRLSRLPASASQHSDAAAAEVAERAERYLRSRHYRVEVDHDPDLKVTTIAAQRGYLREAGNLIFHISLLIVLVAFAIGDLYGYRGAANVIAGQTFTNDRQSYDDFTPGTFFRPDQLEPFSLTLTNLTAEYLPSGPQAGQPTRFGADVTYRSRADDDRTQSKTIEVNKPLQINGTGIFLLGNGYAPVITVRDGRGDVTYSGPTVFLPQDSTYASWGVIKAPDAKPAQLGFDGMFLPTYGSNPNDGAFSQFPDTLAPALSLTAYTGDLGLGSGRPQSVFSLDKADLTAVTDDAGTPLTLTVPLGDSVELPNGLGSISFDRVDRWARLQISRTPAEPYALAGVIAGLMGLLTSLYIRPRRLWLRVRTTDSGDSEVEVAGLDRREGRGLETAVADLLENATRPFPTIPPEVLE